jgi:MoxR-like ATPase
VLEHRIIVRQEAKLKKITPLDIVARAVERVTETEKL